MSSHPRTRSRVRHQVATLPSGSAQLPLPGDPASSTPVDDHSKGSSKGKRRARRPTRKGLTKRDQRLCKATAGIDLLPDEVLLEAFRFYADDWRARTSKWRTLVHVCRRWRRVVLASPRRLGLRVWYGGLRPIAEMADVWPALPIVAVLWTSDDEEQRIACADNIVAALESEHRDRVFEVDLGNVPSSLWARLAAAMEEPLPELTDLQVWLLKDDDPAPAHVPDDDPASASFLGGSAPRLQMLSLENVPLPSRAMRNLLLSAHGLVTLFLSKIPSAGYISPEALVAAMSTMTRLETLFLHFLSPRSRPDPESSCPPQITRSVLPALTWLQFQGVREYLENFLARIDAPLLDNLRVVFFMDIIFDVPQLHRLIGHAQKLKTLDRAMASFFNHSVQFTLSPQAGEADPRHCLCLSTLEELEIMDGDPPPYWKDDVESTQWLKLLDPFAAVKKLYLSKQVALRAGYALQELSEDAVAEVLPALQNLFVEDLEPAEAVREAIEPFVAARLLSGRSVALHHWERR
ncbi:hypothetical protein F5148DRAFT_1377126 [Russula earlei]|uniref:Uncharacterized protein n=1 Tax=Russula earlei TaxID=71964 RepID=A0ACC0U5P8_9AGAM|nr:hypothetical protein F5148DRAFT_1377126 [Russula earlei]